MQPLPFGNKFVLKLTDVLASGLLKSWVRGSSINGSSYASPPHKHLDPILWPYGNCLCGIRFDMLP